MRATWEPPFRYIILAAVIILLAALLWYVRIILRPLLAAGIIAFILSPAASFLMKRFQISRKFAARIVYFATLAAILLLVTTLVPVVLDQAQSVRFDLESALTNLQGLLATPIQLGFLRLDLRLLGPALAELFYRGPIVAQPSQALRFLEMTSRTVVWALVIMVTAYYLMTEWDELRTWIIELAPPAERSGLDRLYLQVRNVWRQYLGGQFRLIAVLAVIYSIAWGIIGLPGAIVLGLLAGVLNLVPEVGPAAVGLLAALVASLEGSRMFVWMPPLWFAALTLGVYLLINTFKSIWLQPRILGRSVLLHEGLVFIAIVAALILNGILGVLIVVPVLASALIVGKYVRRRMLGLPPFDDVMEGPEDPGSVSAAPLERPDMSTAVGESVPSVRTKKNSK